MIAFLKGDFVMKSPAMVHIDVQGVGYEVQISLNTYTRIQAMEKGMLYTLLIVREDAHILYGFADPAEKEMFQLLLGVSGVGASTARMMLSSMKPEEVARAIVNSEVRALEAVKGIGKKTAERIVLELKDKLGKQSLESNIPSLKNNSLQQDALNALTALGINRVAAEQALKKVNVPASDTPVEEIIKAALRIL
ncbi:MAG: Holliday junction branch migration protein RuvA [Chitinophagaceae bacterium]|nr:MAG: Holliday junction branch migration protein RuvA [Chitinophagaceae bacterium]